VDVAVVAALHTAGAGDDPEGDVVARVHHDAPGRVDDRGAEQRRVVAVQEHLGLGRIVAAELEHRICSGIWYEVDES
jgi:hypothetical protein